MEERALKSEDFCHIAKELLKRKTNVKFQARGFSMAPFIKNGDTLILSPLKGGQCAYGDVAAAVRPGTENVFVHRIVGRRRDDYLIKGDNIPGGPDGLFPRANILGIVIKIERNGKVCSFGLGPEKYIIAFLSRAKILSFILWFLRGVKSALFG
ncbi:MAG: S26 family signal peptidase [Candidatus Omnitrophica bacterium]|nr:S26 family signal peptidase [Candidatus Omnitrophota bacterium]